MTKRSLENDIDEMNEEILGDLSHDDRLQLFLEATAQDKEQWRERISEATPRATYEQDEVGFTRRKQLSFSIAQTAIADLHSNLLWYLWAESVSSYSAQVTVVDDEIPPHPLTTLDSFAPSTFLARLYISYEAYQRFAEEELGVTLDIWVSEIPRGSRVVESAADILEEKEAELFRWCGDSHVEEIMGVDLPDDPDAEAAERYELLAEEYQTVLDA